MFTKKSVLDNSNKEKNNNKADDVSSAFILGEFMKRIYDANGQDKEDLIEIDNNTKAFKLALPFENEDTGYVQEPEIGFEDLILVGRVDELDDRMLYDINWYLNGLIKDNEEEDNKIVILEPLKYQNEFILKKISEKDTEFESPILLSNESVILIPEEKYDEYLKEEKYKDVINSRNIRVYRGDEKLAFKMAMKNMYYIYLDYDENGFDMENNTDTLKYASYLTDVIKDIDEKIKTGELDSDGLRTDKDLEEHKLKKRKLYGKNADLERPDIESENSKKITGLTKKTEGSIELDNMYATSDIGKVRSNQEDAVLLIKDKENPKHKMMCVADGMGGWSFGEVASNAIIKKMEDWFNNLTEKQKEYFNNGLEGLKEDLIDFIELKIQPEVEWQTGGIGGSTFVCAIIGDKDTLISNIGDSRAYIVKGKEVIQVSREDTNTQERVEDGTFPTKDASRYDQYSNEITQCLGMDRRLLIHPSCEIVKNEDYDMVLLFTDGVTDCLSDEDIALVCSTTDKKELAKKVVERAIEKDSVWPNEYAEYMEYNTDYNHINHYISGGKDNTSAAVCINKNNKDEKEK